MNNEIQNNNKMRPGAVIETNIKLIERYMLMKNIVYEKRCL